MPAAAPKRQRHPKGTGSLPILRKRGVAASEYEAPTLRERLLGKETAVLRDDHPGAGFRYRVPSLAR